MYLSLRTFLFLLCVLSTALPLLAKHKGDFKKIEAYCATNAWVFPVYEDLNDTHNTGKYFIPVVSSPHHKYPLIVDINDPRDISNKVSSTLRTALINDVFTRKEAIENVFQDHAWTISKNSMVEKFKSSHLKGLIVLDCVAERASQDPSTNADYVYVPKTALDPKFVAALPYANFLNARSDKRFAQTDLCYAVEFFNTDRTEQDALISQFNTFLFEHLKGLTRFHETGFKDEL